MLPENPLLLWVYSYMFWSALYLISAYFIKKYSNHLTSLTAADKSQIAEGCVSIFQGFFCGGTGIIGVLATRHKVVTAKHWFMVPYSTIGSAYFIYDLAAMYYSHCLKEDSKGLSWSDHTKKYFKANTLMIAHHIILIFILFPALVYYSNMGDFFTACFYLTEISTPFVNMRVILTKIGLKSTRLYIVNGVLMTIVFALCRVVMFPYMYLTYLQQAHKGIPYLQAMMR